MVIIVRLCVLGSEIGKILSATRVDISFQVQHGKFAELCELRAASAFSVFPREVLFANAVPAPKTGQDEYTDPREKVNSAFVGEENDRPCRGGKTDPMSGGETTCRKRTDHVGVGRRNQ